MRLARSGSGVCRTRVASSATRGWNRREELPPAPATGSGPGRGSSGSKCVSEAMPARVVTGTLPLEISPFILPYCPLVSMDFLGPLSHLRLKTVDNSLNHDHWLTSIRRFCSHITSCVTYFNFFQTTFCHSKLKHQLTPTP